MKGWEILTNNGWRRLQGEKTTELTWEMQSEGEIGSASLKGSGNGCFHPEMYIHSWKQGASNQFFKIRCTLNGVGFRIC